MLLNEEMIKEILYEYGIQSFSTQKMIDSSHGTEDIRENYIIDNKYVLRVNSFELMNNQRIEEINKLVDRYITIGIKAPKFLLNSKGKYILKKYKYIIYLSEYLNYPIAEDFKNLEEEFLNERIDFISKFAAKYKDIDLVETKSMYSIFDLAPYDIPIGIDEKQQNCDELVDALNTINENNLAEKIKAFNDRIRNELLGIYKSLPKCVFHGDENFSNLCVKDNHIIGLFDFNMYGTDVIANYFANTVFLSRYRYDKDFEETEIPEFLKLLSNDFKYFTEKIQVSYLFSEIEFKAYKLYAKLVLLFSYSNIKAFIFYFNNEYKNKCLKLLDELISLEL